MLVDTERYKREAAEYAVRYVQSGMVIGLGHGSTAHYAVEHIALQLRLHTLTDLLAIPCSCIVENEARTLGIPLTTLEEHPQIDLTIDGADEVSPEFHLIKGGGGALLHEKIVAQATRREIIVIDESKYSPVLGTRAVVPVEVTPFGWKTQQVYLERLGAECILRVDESGKPMMTDERNWILDCHFGVINAPGELALQLQAHAGIIAHGIFLHAADSVVIAGAQGVREMRKNR